jgi:hypothetical protein
VQPLVPPKKKPKKTQRLTKEKKAGPECQWLTSAILATQEAESKRIAVQSQLDKQFLRPISKKPLQKRAGGMAQGVGPEFKPQYHKKQNKTKGWG